MRKRKTQEPDAPADDAAGDAAVATDDDGNPIERAAIVEAPVADTDAEFPTDWHRDRYIADCEREVEGAKRRLEELQDSGGAHPDALADQQTMIDNASAELARVRKAYT